MGLRRRCFHSSAGPGVVYRPDRDRARVDGSSGLFSLVGAALTVVLSQCGWIIDAGPGNPVTATLDGEVIMPFEVLGRLLSDELSAEEWLRTCRNAGIADVDLAEAGLDAAAAPTSAYARDGFPSAQEPGQRHCVHCEAPSGQTACFCWRCYQPVDGDDPAPLSPSAPALQSVETTEPNRLRLFVVVVVVILAAFGGYRYLISDGSVRLPENIHGLSRFDDARSTIAVKNVHSDMVIARVEGDVAFYGWDAPTAAVMWIRGASTKTIDDAFEEHAYWFSGRDGLLDASEKTTETIDGATYVCAPVIRPFRAPGTICMWQDKDLFWLLLDSSGQRPENARSLAVSARDAIEST